jgi:CBS domain-containing protein
MPDETGTAMKAPLNAGDICTRTVTIAYPVMSVADAARLMHERHVGCLVVVEELSPAERIVTGILTDRDIALGVVAADRDPHSTRVGDIMTRTVATAREEDSLLDLLSAMRRKGVRRIPVTGPQGRLVGIVALDDVLEVLADQMEAVAKAAGAASHLADDGVQPQDDGSAPA